MFWADKVAKEIINSGKHKPYWVDDMKTPSGFSHVGSMMGPIIHSMILRALRDAGQKATYTFVINDFDTMDELPPQLGEDFRKYMGMSLKMAPSPVAEYTNLADYFGTDFVNSIKSLGVEAEILSSWELYHQGKFDGVIKAALDNAAKVQDIYQKISGSQKKEQGWLPFQVICKKCQKLGTTRVFAWDGKKVSYRCEPNMVKWAVGCGHEGKMSPFGGSGKLPWKVDWAAHWKVIGITVEGAGKDHASKGGSYDIAMSLCEEVFDYPKPFRLPYEFILIGGKKMSSSKGLGLKAHDLVKILPPSVARFLFARNGIKSQTNFDPEGTDAIPVLFDDYQKCADAYFKNQNEQDLARAFELSQVGEIQKPPVIRFSVLAQWVQMPNMEEEIKKEGLEEWAEYARVWVEKFAPEKDKFVVQKELPEVTKNLLKEQKEFLKKLSLELDKVWSAEEFQTRIYEMGKELGLGGKDTFAAIYASLLGKDHGPKAAWLILSLDKKFVKERFSASV
jgi:lysyl-tRNA synthetase, class I